MQNNAPSDLAISFNIIIPTKPSMGHIHEKHEIYYENKTEDNNLKLHFKRGA